MFGLSRVIKKTEVGPAVEIIDVDRAIERFENDEEVVTLCTESVLFCIIKAETEQLVMTMP